MSYVVRYVHVMFAAEPDARQRWKWSWQSARRGSLGALGWDRKFYPLAKALLDRREAVSPPN